MHIVCVYMYVSLYVLFIISGDVNLFASKLKHFVVVRLWSGDITS